MDPLLMTGKGVGVLDRARDRSRNRLSPWWAALGALVALAIWWLVFR